MTDKTALALSYGQQQLWSLDLLASGLPAYHLARAIRINGELDVDALRRALDALKARHEALRTRLVSRDGQPYQVVDEPSATPLPAMDLSMLPLAEAEVRFRALAGEEAASPFAWDAGPLLRLLLLRIAADCHALVVTAHQTVFDGESFAVLAQELTELYAAEVSGGRARLAALPAQPADYAAWERGHLRGVRLDELAGYWQQTLDGAATLQLPTDRPRPPVQTYDGATATVGFGGDLLDGLKALSRAQGTTLFVTLMAGFKALLHRYSGQDDIVVGTLSANRDRPEWAPLIGCLANTLAVRTQLSGELTFAGLMQRVKSSTVGAYAHQDLPFAKVLEALRMHRDPSRSPLFQAGFMLAEGRQRQILAGGLHWSTEELQLPAARYDLLFSAVEHDDQLTVDVSYATALFDAATVRRMLEHYRVLLEGAIADPGQPVSQLPLLTSAELHRQLAEWNPRQTVPPSSDSTCLHTKFQEQAAATPEGIAVELDGATVTYAELNAQANQVARRLRRLGTGPETLIGVCMQRSLRRFAGLLGILKAGGGYVPLDPQYPRHRLSFMVQDAHLAVVLTDEESESALPDASTTVLNLDRDWPDLCTLEESNLDDLAGPSNAAYVIYTSGSTGRPNGVVTEHRQAVNFTTGEIGHWPLGPGDRILQFTSLSFDASVLEIFGALLSGATLVLGSSETLLSPPRLADLIRRERITFMCLPPAMLNLLADEEFPSLRVVIAGGEVFSSTLVRRWARPGTKFVNGYGTTETTVGAAMAECDRDSLIDPPPIGLPLPGYTAHVLDRNLALVPVGVPGELHIGGAGVARGYLHRPELTAERFIGDPFDPDPAARLYKTGDLARRLPDGNLQYLGRLDDQVKIRGLRVELGEIEAVLAAHPAVAQAVAAAGLDRTGQKQLLAYARIDPHAPSVNPAELRAHLAERLPSFMVPTYLMTLETFPLHADGKVDRSALPSPDSAGGAACYEPPRTLLELVLVDMFADQLKLARVGVNDSFFDLGGNSLQAMQLVIALRRELEVDTDITAIFLAPTAARLVALLRDRHEVADVDLDELHDELDTAPVCPQVTRQVTACEGAPGGPR